eukprot:766155-Hanusia_phi.AAC.1
MRTAFRGRSVLSATCEQKEVQGCRSIESTSRNCPTSGKSIVPLSEPISLRSHSRIPLRSLHVGVLLLQNIPKPKNNPMPHLLPPSTSPSTSPVQAPSALLLVVLLRV